MLTTDLKNKLDSAPDEANLMKSTAMNINTGWLRDGYWMVYIHMHIYNLLKEIHII